MVYRQKSGDVSRLSDSPSRLRIASRESALALWQANHVKALLESWYPACKVEILGMTTRGDQILDRSLSAIGGKGLFTKELETALLDDSADLAVHSLKDVPMELPDGFTLSAILQREDPRDAFVSIRFESLESLRAGARIGTSSLRRGAQLHANFPHVRVLELRGNVNTRLAKLDRGEYDAIVLAAAGLKRLGLADRIRQILPPELSLPAAGQGALAIETLTARVDVREWIKVLEHPPTSWACEAERTVSRLLGGSCRAPLAAYCNVMPSTEHSEQRGLQNVAESEAHSHAPSVRMSLRALAASIDGATVLHANAVATVYDVTSAVALGQQVAQRLISDGAIALLAEPSH